MMASSLVDVFDGHASCRPHSEAVIDVEGTWTYLQLCNASQAAAAAMAHFGLTRPIAQEGRHRKKGSFGKRVFSERSIL